MPPPGAIESINFFLPSHKLPIPSVHHFNTILLGHIRESQSYDRFHAVAYIFAGDTVLSELDYAVWIHAWCRVVQRHKGVDVRRFGYVALAIPHDCFFIRQLQRQHVRDIQARDLICEVVLTMLCIEKNIARVAPGSVYRLRVSRLISQVFVTWNLPIILLPIWQRLVTNEKAISVFEIRKFRPVQRMKSPGNIFDSAFMRRLVHREEVESFGPYLQR